MRYSLATEAIKSTQRISAVVNALDDLGRKTEGKPPAHLLAVSAFNLSGYRTTLGKLGSSQETVLPDHTKSAVTITMAFESENTNQSRESDPRPDTASSKGKEKAAPRDESGQPAPRPTDGNSVMARLGKSAAGLSRSVFQSTPSANELANVGGSAGKAEASSSSVHPETVAESSSTARASSSAGPGVFRSGQAGAHAAAEEAAFSEFLDSTEVFNPTTEAWSAASWKAPGSTATATATPPSEQALMQGAVGSSVARQQERDGVEVVHLLSHTDEEMPPYEEEEVSLSETELNSLRRALFDEGAPAQMSASDWNNMLNLVPDFVRGPEGSENGARRAQDSYMALGVTDTAEAGQLWLEEWHRVLTSYTDEVWGDLADLVREARADVQQVKETRDGQMPDLTALRRLQTVITRVRARL